VPKPFSKRAIAGFWMVRIIRAMLFILSLLLGAQSAQAATPSTNDYRMARSEAGSILVFEDAQVVPKRGYAIPQTGWERNALPIFWPPPVRKAKNDPHQTVWARMTFTRAALPSGPIAIYTIDSRERLIIFLNGVDIARNFASDDDLALGANKPLLVSVSQQLLRNGENEIIVRSQRTRQSDVGFGTIAIGSAAVLENMYYRQNMWRSLLQAGASYTMLALGFMVLALWRWRREEPELLFLGVSGIFWFLRNYQFFAGRAYEPFALFRFLSDVSVFIAGGAMLCYCVLHLRLPNRWFVVKYISTASILTAIGFTSLWGIPKAQVSAIGLAILAVVPIIFYLGRSWAHVPKGGAWPMLFVVCVLVLFSAHDMGRMPNIRWWEGFGFLMQPFAGIVLFFVFLMVTGRRLAVALSQVERANVELEASVAKARAELAASEEARREIEVERAIDSERARLMREMHDGIGSNLVTALAIAQKSKESPRTIATLQRALSDLKITVDSLAPVDGDLVALLANLRHRMQPDLAEAGLKSIWNAEECPPLIWLDAPNALHMLRIIQEAIGNILTHAKASELKIGCEPSEWEGHAGVEIELTDNGIGFDPVVARKRNHGLDNMHQRARMLGGRLSISAAPGTGATLRLWLPVERKGIDV
jgi:signal transduction histidine kinase